MLQDDAQLLTSVLPPVAHSLPPPSMPLVQFVGVKLKGSFCPTWAYEAIPNPVNPANLYRAMLDKRLGGRKTG